MSLSLVLKAGCLATVMMALAALPASADEASSQDMSAGQAIENMGDDAEKVGDKAVEIGEGAAEAAEEAYDAAAEKAEEAYEWSKKQVKEVTE